MLPIETILATNSPRKNGKYGKDRTNYGKVKVVD